jgi:RND family efflux transporter MFP subunit
MKIQFMMPLIRPTHFSALFSLFIVTTSFAADAPIVVSAESLSELQISSTSSAPANIISLNHSTLSAEVTGQALKVEAETGDFVKEGQKLVSLDCRSYSLAKKQANAALKVARTQLNYSKKQLRRNQNLVKKGIIPRDAFEKIESGQLTAQADILLKKASIETADLAISRCNILAPFAGQITQRMVQKGQLVTAGTPLFQLMQTGRLELKAKLSPNDVAKLRKSPLLEFIAGNTKIKTTVRSIIQTIDEATRTQEVRLSLPPNTNVATGLSGRIQWRDQQTQLPAEYILRRGNKLGIMIADDVIEGIGKAKFHSLADAQEGQPATINLSNNTAIITLNRYRVKDGDAIKVQ